LSKKSPQCREAQADACARGSKSPHQPTPTVILSAGEPPDGGEPKSKDLHVPGTFS